MFREHESVVDEAEQKRAVITSSTEAIKVAEIAEAPFKRLSDEEIAAVIADPYDRLILACLTRIDVDARKTAANLIKNPKDSFTQLEAANETIQRFNRNEDFNSGLKGVSKDHKGREHHFLAEKGRDESKVAESAADFYLGENRDRLLTYAEEKLKRTYESLPDDHATKPLIAVEIELLREIQGKSVNEERLLNGMFGVAAQTYNMDRVATVCAWVRAYGERVDNTKIIDYADSSFQQASEGKFDWDQKLASARQKPGMKQKRAIAFGIASQGVISPARKNNLVNSLTSDLAI